MTRGLYLLLLGAAVFLPGREWLAAADLDAVLARSDAYPEGQLFYLAAKLLGMVGMSLVLLQLGLAVLSRAGIIRLPRADHRVLGTLATLVIIGHVASFITATTMRADHTTFHLLVPDLTNGSYNRGVGLGAIGLWVLLAGVGVRAVRTGLPAWTHRLAVAGGVMGLGHAVWIGTEKDYIWAMVALLAILAITASVLGQRSPMARRVR